MYTPAHPYCPSSHQKCLYYSKGLADFVAVLKANQLIVTTAYTTSNVERRMLARTRERVGVDTHRTDLHEVLLPFYGTLRRTNASTGSSTGTVTGTATGTAVLRSSKMQKAHGGQGGQGGQGWQGGGNFTASQHVRSHAHASVHSEGTWRSPYCFLTLDTVVVQEPPDKAGGFFVRGPGEEAFSKGEAAL